MIATNKLLRYSKATAAVVILLGCVEASEPLSPAAQRGHTFVGENCARCHSVDKITSSALAIAPPFRTLHLRYPVEDLSEALGEGIQTGHPTMPQFQLDPGQIGDVIAYLKSLAD